VAPPSAEYIPNGVPSTTLSDLKRVGARAIDCCCHDVRSRDDSSTASRRARRIDASARRYRARPSRASLASQTNSVRAMTRIGGRGDRAAVDDYAWCRRLADVAAPSSRGRDLGGRGPKRTSAAIVAVPERGGVAVPAAEAAMVAGVRGAAVVAATGGPVVPVERSVLHTSRVLRGFISPRVGS